ncbi:MAG: VOC family protein, partial [Isosphaeraceae bacterium]
MAARVTSVFLYVKDVRRSLEFYNEVVGAEVLQVHAEHEGALFSLAILRLDDFTLMIHPQEAHAEEFADTRLGVGIHLQIQVDDVDAFYQHCMDEGAI